MALSDRLTNYLLREWRDDLEPGWRNFFEGATPNIEDVPDVQAPEIFPARLNFNRPRVDEEEEIPSRHLVRAFDGLAPNAVRVVVIGQDPYPRQASATGRAFEEGAWNGDPTNMAESLQRIFQSAILSAGNVAGVSAVDRDWPTICRKMAEDAIETPVMADYFNGLAAQGVLFVNAAWTFTEPQHKKTHLEVWKPVMRHLLDHLVQREDRPIVFLLFGDDARKVLSGARSQRPRQYDEASMKIVRCAHPTARGGISYFYYPNPLKTVNLALAELGDTVPVQWWPPFANVPA